MTTGVTAPLVGLIAGDVLGVFGFSGEVPAAGVTVAAAALSVRAGGSAVSAGGATLGLEGADPTGDVGAFVGARAAVFCGEVLTGAAAGTGTVSLRALCITFAHITNCAEILKIQDTNAEILSLSF